MADPVRDFRKRPLVAVTGMGVLTCLGNGCEDNWRALTAGQSGLRHITRFPTEGLRSTVAGTVDAHLPGAGQLHAVERSARMAEIVARQAVEQAGIAEGRGFPGPLFIATPPSEFEWPQLLRMHAAGPDSEPAGYPRLLAAARSGAFAADYELLQFTTIADRLVSPQGLGIPTQPISVCTACASGATAIALGMEAIRRGEAQAVLCVGADGTIHPEAMVRFSLLSALSTHNAPPERALRPFARDRDGFVPAEGAAALVLEDYGGALARGALILGFVLGYGEKADDYHRTRSKPDASGPIAAMEGALADAGIGAEAVDYVNAHGTGTQENDKTEYLALSAVLGERAATTPVSSNKSMIGHTLIAAGAVEAVFSLLTIATGTMPPTTNCEDRDPDIHLDVIPSVKRESRVRTVLSNSFGFGGQNASLVFSGDPVPPTAERRR
jgi:3-oxoacyl-[acyl-carrier-protein] synthase II